MNKFDIMESSLVTFYGEGAYSGNSKTQCLFVPNDILVNIKEELLNCTPYFCELDGKHSEVRGSVNIEGVTESNIRSLLLEYYNKDDYMKVVECLEEILGYTEDLEEALDRVLEYNGYVDNNLHVEITTSVWFGEQNLGD